MTTKSEIKKILLTLSTMPNTTIRENNLEYAIEAYHIVLNDLDFQVLEAAAAQYLSSGTFFPAPGQLRQTAIELQLAANGIPTAAEAWADVLKAVRHIDAVYCPEGWHLRELALKADDANDGPGYVSALNRSILHSHTCSECRPSRTEEVYRHPVVERTVKRLGGREALFTDNEAADRARFIQAYNEILIRERREYGRIPAVAAYIEQKRAAIEAGGEVIEELDAPKYQSIIHDLREEG